MTTTIQVAIFAFAIGAVVAHVGMDRDNAESHRRMWLGSVLFIANVLVAIGRYL